MASRAKPQFALVLQERDLAFLRDLFECRIMTGEQASVLHFADSKEAAKKRLQKLKAAGLITERPRRAFDPAVLHLTKAGFALLQEQGILAEYPAFDLPALERRTRVSALTLAHELEVMDVKVSFHREAKKTEALSVVEFSTWPLVNEFTATRGDGTEVFVRPDGFLRLHEKDGDGLSEHSFYLEVDRSTETQSTLASRASYYLDHYKSGGFAARNNAPRSSYKDYPFRVLMVFKTAERRNNMAERLLKNNPPIYTHAYLATIEDATRDPFGAIWIRPIDYRDATEGTNFQADATASAKSYRRQVSRDAFLEASLKKHTLTGE